MGLRNKAFGITAAAACLALLVAGCSGDSSTEDESDDGATTAAPEPATVRVMVWGNDADISSIQEAAEGFSAAHPEITIEWETGDCGVDYAACKTLVKQRLCRSGMRWKENGAQMILSLRALLLTQTRWAQFWSKIEQYGVPEVSRY